MSRREGHDEGLQEGREEGERRGLSQSIRQLSHVFEIVIEPEHEARLGVSSAELRTLLDHIVRCRAWPNP